MVTSTDRPEPVAVEIPYSGGLSQAVTWPWPASDLALLVLHDLDADLDSLRWLCDALAGAGVHVLSIDLPGHGLSGGDVNAHGPDVVAAAYRSLTETVAGAVGIVAHGRSAQLLLTSDLGDPPVAVAFLDPRRIGVARQKAASSWQHVPKLVVLSAGAAGDYAEQIIGDTTAWCLRADLVGLGQDTADSEGFEVHVVSLMLKFLLEQAAFELSARRRAGPVAGGTHSGEEPGWTS